MWVEFTRTGHIGRSSLLAFRFLVTSGCYTGVGCVFQIVVQSFNSSFVAWIYNRYLGRRPGEACCIDCKLDGSLFLGADESARIMAQTGNFTKYQGRPLALLV
jgi:hypothetical protein